MSCQINTTASIPISFDAEKASIKQRIDNNLKLLLKLQNLQADILLSSPQPQQRHHHQPRERLFDDPQFLFSIKEINDYIQLNKKQNQHSMISSIIAQNQMPFPLSPEGNKKKGHYCNDHQVKKCEKGVMLRGKDEKYHQSQSIHDVADAKQVSTSNVVLPLLPRAILGVTHRASATPDTNSATSAHIHHSGLVAPYYNLQHSSTSKRNLLLQSLLPAAFVNNNNSPEAHHHKNEDENISVRRCQERSRGRSSTRRTGLMFNSRNDAAQDNSERRPQESNQPQGDKKSVCWSNDKNKDQSQQQQESASVLRRRYHDGGQQQGKYQALSTLTKNLLDMINEDQNALVLIDEERRQLEKNRVATTVAATAAYSSTPSSRTMKMGVRSPVLNNLLYEQTNSFKLSQQQEMQNLYHQIPLTTISPLLDDPPYSPNLSGDHVRRGTHRSSQQHENVLKYFAQQQQPSATSTLPVQEKNTSTTTSTRTPPITKYDHNNQRSSMGNEVSFHLFPLQYYGVDILHDNKKTSKIVAHLRSSDRHCYDVQEGGRSSCAASVDMKKNEQQWRGRGRRSIVDDENSGTTLLPFSSSAACGTIRQIPVVKTKKKEKILELQSVVPTLSPHQKPHVKPFMYYSNNANDVSSLQAGVVASIATKINMNPATTKIQEQAKNDHQHQDISSSNSEQEQEIEDKEEQASKLSSQRHSSNYKRKRKYDEDDSIRVETKRNRTKNINPNKQSRRSNSLSGVPKVRRWLPLGLDEDSSHLSAFLCFLRSECIEVFVSSKADVIERMTSKKIREGQIGIRCRFCAHLSQKNRVGRSSNFPSSIAQIYPGISMMIYNHFALCPEMPTNLRKTFNQLKNFTKKGNAESRTYWVHSAKQLGMVDAVGPTGNFHYVQMDPKRPLHHSMKQNFEEDRYE